ncbi:unnamed protein product, partial [Callosobruchus maculatus]
GLLCAVSVRVGLRVIQILCTIPDIPDTTNRQTPRTKIRPNCPINSAGRLAFLILVSDIRLHGTYLNIWRRKFHRRVTNTSNTKSK